MQEVSNEEKEAGVLEETMTEDFELERERKALYRKGMRRGVLLSLFIVVLILSGLNLFMLSKGILSVTKTPSNSGNAVSESGEVVNEIGLTEEQMTKAMSLYQLLGIYYNEELDSDTMAEGVYHGILEGAGDEYTQYFSADELSTYNNYTDNVYYGIGVGFVMDDEGKAYITTVYDDSPALEAGIQEEDRIVAIEGESIIGWDSSDVSSRIRGEEGTYVTLTMEREDTSFDLKVERRDITLNTVANVVVNDIGYVVVSKFGNRTAEEFEEAIAELTEEGVAGIIIDLRNNTGGRVDAAVRMMDAVLGEGVTLTMANKGGEDKVYTSDEEHKVSVPMVVLVNEKTASSSEIFVAAVHDFGAGVLVGTTTFGKGVYQNVYPLKDGSAVKITSGKFFSPKGDNFNKVGITPDYEVEYEEDENAELIFGYESDSQLKKAFEVMYEMTGINPEDYIEEATAEN